MQEHATAADASAASLGPKAWRRGTHRLVDPAATVARVQPFLAEMGITRIANVTGLDNIGIPVVQAVRPNGRSLSVSQGKGRDLVAARASALMEAIESYHAERVHLPLLLASLGELRGRRPVVDCDALPRLAVSRFHDDLRTLWVEGHDFMADAGVLVPFEMVHTDYTLPLPPGSGSFVMSSVGLSSGNHPLEAVSHGICEVVEQDATTLWALSSPEQRQERLLDLDSVQDPDCRERLERYRSAGVRVGVWDATSDVGIPTFVCGIVDEQPNWLRSLFANRGMGCHPVPEIALLRALNEAAQSRVTLISGARDDSGRELFERAQASSRIERARDEMSRPARRRFQDVARFDGPTFAADVAWELERLRAIGVQQVVVVDLTKPEFGVPVVRVVIPGLEPVHDVPGFVPGPRARRVLEGGAA